MPSGTLLLLLYIIFVIASLIDSQNRYIMSMNDVTIAVIDQYLCVFVEVCNINRASIYSTIKISVGTHT